MSCKVDLMEALPAKQWLHLSESDKVESYFIPASLSNGVPWDIDFTMFVILHKVYLLTAGMLPNAGST